MIGFYSSNFFEVSRIMAWGFAKHLDQSFGSLLTLKYCRVYGFHPCNLTMEHHMLWPISIYSRLRDFAVDSVDCAWRSNSMWGETVKLGGNDMMLKISWWWWLYVNSRKQPYYPYYHSSQTKREIHGLPNIWKGQYMEVSINGGFPKWLVYSGKPHLEIDDN